MKDKKFKMGQLLMESLTAEQIACMLEVVASAGYLKSLMDDFAKVDPDKECHLMCVKVAMVGLTA